MSRTYAKVRIHKGFLLYVFILKNTLLLFFTYPCRFLYLFYLYLFFLYLYYRTFFTGTVLPVPFFAAYRSE